MSMTVRHIDRGSVIEHVEASDDALLAFAGEDAYAEGTVLGRKTTSADSYAGVIVGTGAKTIALTPRAGRSMKVGDYVLTVGNVTAGVGPATLVDPDGIAEDITLATSGAHQFPLLGVTMTITTGGTELDDNATVTFTVAAPTSRVYVPYSPTGVNGAQVARSVLLYPVSRATAGNESIKVPTKGAVVRERLVVDGGGTVTELLVDQLRNAGFIVRETQQLADTEGVES